VSILAALADPIRLQIVKRLGRRQEIAGVELARKRIAACFVTTWEFSSVLAL
jgi:hypothetical protein